MNWYFVLKFLHIIAAIIFVGGIFGRQLVRSNAKKTDNVQIFAALSQAAGRIESLMIIPPNLIIIILGMILALWSGAPIFGFLQGSTQNWLLAANVLMVSGLLIVPTVFIPRGKKFAVILETALAKGEMTSELRAAIDDPLVKLCHRYEEVSLMVIVALMVMKPF